MGELHLEIIVDRLLREFHVEANVGAPQVAYKEAFTKAVEVDSKYAKQSGGRGQYGHCKVKFEPLEAHTFRRTWSSYHDPVFWNEGLWSSRTSLRERALRNNPTGLFPVSSCI